MKYLLIEESAYDRLKSQTETKSQTAPSYGEKEYWVTSKEACQILNVRLATLNAFRQNSILSCISINRNNHFKRSEVCNLKMEMDKDMLSVGCPIEISRIVKTAKSNKLRDKIYSIFQRT